MSGINKVILVGNVGGEPEIKTTNNGGKIAIFSVATSESWKDAVGQKQEKTEWHRIVVFSKGLSDIVERYVHKGSKIYIEGSLQTSKKISDNGEYYYKTEIVLGGYNGTIQLLDRTPPKNQGVEQEDIPF